jgi:diaminopimelate epimerase
MESVGGVLRARVLDDGFVSVDMGIPNFEPHSLPMEAPTELPAYTLKIDGAEIEFGAVSMGNPHVVLRVADVKTAPVERFGPTIERHPRFAQRTNRSRIRLRVYERGVGETQACGTGACAAVAIGRSGGLLDSDVRVELPGGTAIVTWPGPKQHLWLTGPATMVFTGSIDI